MDIQRLRCKVNFEALVFVPHVRALGNALINRLRYPSDRSINNLQKITDANEKQRAGKFVVLHLRFDKVSSKSTADFCLFEGLICYFV